MNPDFSWKRSTDRAVHGRVLLYGYELRRDEPRSTRGERLVRVCWSILILIAFLIGAWWAMVGAAVLARSGWDAVAILDARAVAPSSTVETVPVTQVLLIGGALVLASVLLAWFGVVAPIRREQVGRPVFIETIRVSRDTLRLRVNDGTQAVVRWSDIGAVDGRDGRVRLQLDGERAYVSIDQDARTETMRRGQEIVSTEIGDADAVATRLRQMLADPDARQARR